MSEKTPITQQFLEVVKISESPFDRAIVPVLLAVGILYAGAQGLEGDWVEMMVFSFGVVLLLALATVQPLQKRLLGGDFTRLHAVYIALYWVYSVIWLSLLRAIIGAPWTGKESEETYLLLILFIAFTVMALRALASLLPVFHQFFITQIPIWEQMLVAVNEMIAAGLLALVGADILAHVFQPDVFTTRIELAYTIGLILVVGVYYLGMQLMWVRGWNAWLGRNKIWVRLARILTPVALIVATMVIVRRFVARAEPRTANLLGDASADLAILALGSVIWLVILVVMLLVYTSNLGLRQRFLPDELLNRVPDRLERILRSVSDMDMLLMIGMLSTLIPIYLLLLDDSSGVIGSLRQRILQSGNALIETSEQALAVLFAAPFYVLVILLLALYAYVFSRPNVPAEERDELIDMLPVGFLIVLIITLYLFAIPFSQVLVEGRLPQLPRDLGRILAFNVVIPLGLLYLHYFVFIRLPYGRGQARWRETRAFNLKRQLETTDQRIENLTREIETLDRSWSINRSPSDANLGMQVDTLYRYVQLNGLRDDLNMQRLQIVAARQQLTELSDAPVSVTVARLPIRVVSLGIPVLLVIQLYQWAFLNEGLREIVNNPNITVIEFFQIILQQAQF